MDPNCTFQPSVLKKKKQNQPGASSDKSEALNVIERSKIWIEKREEKIKKSKDEEKDKDLENCTFKPQVELKKRNCA